jgi:hypothetical protein
MRKVKMKRLAVLTIVMMSLRGLLYSLQSNDYEINWISPTNNYSNNWISGGNISLKGSAGQNLAGNEALISSNGVYKVRNGFYNPPKKQFQKNLPIDFTYDDFHFSYAAGSSVLDEFEFFVEEGIKDNSIKKADEKMSKLYQMVLSSTMTFMSAFYDEEFFVTKSEKDGRVSITLEDRDNDGYLDGTNIKIKTIKGYIFDPKYEMWVKANNQSITNYSNKILLSFNVNGGIYGVIGKLDIDVSEVYAYPVPFRPNGPKAGDCDGCSGTEEKGITFANVPQRGYIEIYTIDGRLVRKLVLNENDEEVRIYSRKKWDTRNESGEKVVSGVYIWRVVSENKILGTKNSKTGKLIIIR